MYESHQDMLDAQRKANRELVNEAKKLAQIIGVSEQEMLTSLFLRNARWFWIEAMAAELMGSPLKPYREWAMRQAMMSFVEHSRRRDPFAEFGSYSGLTEPMKPHKW